MKKNKTILEHILLGLIPFTEENLKLAFNPSAFFREMERITGSTENTIKKTMVRARERGFLSGNKALPEITEKGLKKVRRYRAEKMPNGYLMVIFDIPHDLKPLRDKFRYFLRIMEFKPTQKSVWTSTYDHRENLKEVISAMGLENYVQTYECIKLRL